MKIAVIGSTGQLGSDVLDVFGKSAYPLSHDDIEVKDLDSCKKVLKNFDAVINCAAYVRVDDSEDCPEEAFMVNAIGARNVSLVCDKKRITNIYISTDAVFDGKKRACYNEDDLPNPINVYGLSKYAGEIFTRNCCRKFYIIRSSSLFGKRGASGKGGNFVESVIGKAKNNETIKVVDDVIISPTYTMDVAYMIKKIFEAKLPYGVYHVANHGLCSWFEFAKKIFELLKTDAKILPIKSLEFKKRAKTPAFSALESIKLNKYNLKMRNWEDSLKMYLIEKGYL